MPKVSVVLPVYNVEKYIDKCIQSLLKQTLKDVEFIFVDDCSPDSSVAIIQKYNDPRIKLIRHEVNKYTAEARNTGIKAATGEYIAFVDSDDYIDSDFLKKLYITATKNKADIAKGIIRYIPTNHLFNNNNTIKLNKYRFNNAPWSALYKRDLFNKPYVKFYVDTMVGQFLLVYYANKIVFNNDAVYNYVTRPGSCVTTGFTPERWRRLNIRGAELILDFMNKLPMTRYEYCFVLRKTILKLYQFGYKKMSKEDKVLCKEELLGYLDTLLTKIKYKDNQFLADYNTVRSKYA